MREKSTKVVKKVKGTVTPYSIIITMIELTARNQSIMTQVWNQLEMTVISDLQVIHSLRGMDILGLDTNVYDSLHSKVSRLYIK